MHHTSDPIPASFVHGWVVGDKRYLVLCWGLQVFLRDTDERACAYIAGAAPNRWGFTSDGRDLNTLIEPVPPSLSGRLSLIH